LAYSWNQTWNQTRLFNELNLSNQHGYWGLVSAEGIEPSTY
jgi:hypothetical protein